jgi:3D (Asp-Asp-Asp) domain-containing protein
MEQRNRRILHSKPTWLLLLVGGVVCVLVVGAIEVLFSVRSTMTTTHSPQPTSLTRLKVRNSTVVTVTSTRTSQRPQLIPVTVRAYTLQGPMADGKQTRAGACAVSVAQFPLGTILYLYNADGSFNRQCMAEDTGSDIQYGQIDVAMPGDVNGATNWGTRHMWARVVRRGWGNSPTPLPTPVVTYANRERTADPFYPSPLT